MRERRAALGGVLPRRVVRAKPLPQPPDTAYEELRKGSGKQAVATTMAFVRLLKELMKDPAIKDRFVPIIPDEARTFGMDSLFPTAKIYSPHGRATTRWTATCCSPTRSPRRARSCTRGSASPARWAR